MSRALQIDLLLNYASLAVLAVGGLAMNLVVVRWMGEAALGIFNQAYAIYIACSQLAVGGVHLSVLRRVAQAPRGDAEIGPIIASGLTLSIALGAGSCALVLVSRGFLGAMLGSPEVVDSLAFVAPALILFSLNKTLLAALNGMECMRLFAALSALRFLVLITVLVAVALERRPAADLSASFVCAEVVVTLAALGCVMARVRLRPGHVRRAWLGRHLSFGVRGFLSGVFIELNTRIDVLAIGFFLSDTEVGRYSLAAVFAEGLYQCLIVVRNQMNPVLAKLWVAGDTKEIVRLVHKAWRYLYPGMALTYVAGLAVFHWVLRYHVQAEEPGAALACYAILGAGVLVVSGFVPFDGILLHSGRPGHYTSFTCSIAVTNLVLNLMLIPLLGIAGAALATGLALGLSVFYLSAIMRWQLGFSYLGRAPGSA